MTANRGWVYRQVGRPWVAGEIKKGHEDDDEQWDGDQNELGDPLHPVSSRDFAPGVATPATPAIRTSCMFSSRGKVRVM
jgi:hypothetical protein